MPQFSLPWPAPAGGGGIGDGASPYTSTQLITAFRRMFGNGVFAGYGDELEVTGTSSPLSVGYGAACVNGFQYDATQDDAPYSIAVPTPTTGTTGHIVVVRADWALQTVRLALRSSADGTAAFPTPVVVEGTTSEILLAQLTITTGGVITVTDARDFLYFHTKVDPTMIDSRTRKVFVPVSYGYNMTTLAWTAPSGSGLLMTSTEETLGAAFFYVPSDYESGLTLTPIMVSIGSGNLRWSANYDYGLINEASNAHNVAVAATTTAISANVRVGLPATTPGSVAANQYIEATVHRYGADGADTIATGIYFAGILASYTADG